MKKQKGLIAMILAFSILSSNMLVFGQANAKAAIKTGECSAEEETGLSLSQKNTRKVNEIETFKPIAIGGKSAIEENHKRKFPWLLVGGIVVAGTVAAVLLLKKKSTPSDSTPTATIKEPEMIRLPGGTFIMGSESSEAFDIEKPVHQVTVSEFEIGKYEVTQAEWESVMGSNPSSFKGSRLPVEKVSWDDIQAYLQKMNTLTGKRYRLPTEAEWEYACRAGTTGDRYGSLDSIAWYSDNSGNRTHDVGGKTPNGFGLYDMLGNVAEWCSDWYGTYSAGAVTNPKGPSSGSRRIQRGGEWGLSARGVRASYRGSNIPDHSYYNLGFRLVRT